MGTNECKKVWGLGGKWGGANDNREVSTMMGTGRGVVLYAGEQGAVEIQNYVRQTIQDKAQKRVCRQARANMNKCA
jgi:hypothetical protein